MIRMRTILFFCTLLVVAAMVLVPDFSAQTMRLEAFGWQLEMRQGFFVILLLILLWLLYAVRGTLRLLLAGQGRLRLGLRSGKLGRQERRLRDSLMKWVDAEGDLGQRGLSKSNDVIPSWLSSSLQRVCVNPEDINLPLDTEDEALGNAIAARIVTDASHHQHFDHISRRLHLQAWLKASPDSLLAKIRLAKLDLEQQDWAQAAAILEPLQKKSLPLQETLSNSGEQGDLNVLLAQAWLGMAETEEQPKQRLRKIRRLAPNHGATVLRLGQLMLPGEGTQAVKKLWLDFLQEHDDEAVAAACFELLKPEALPCFRKLEHIRSTPAFQWMKARLAHACQLEGLADEILDRLLAEHPRANFLRTRARWLQDREQWTEACSVWQQAMDAEQH
jgi:tetratricopeptide (TPR) repeat protein